MGPVRDRLGAPGRWQREHPRCRRLATAAAKTPPWGGTKPVIRVYPTRRTTVKKRTRSWPIRLALETLETRALPSFITAPSYFVGSFDPTSVAIGDFNSDNVPDLVTANGFGQSTVSVLLGEGNGAFRGA